MNSAMKDGEESCNVAMKSNSDSTLKASKLPMIHIPKDVVKHFINGSFNQNDCKSEQSKVDTLNGELSQNSDGSDHKEDIAPPSSTKNVEVNENTVVGNSSSESFKNSNSNKCLSSSENDKSTIPQSKNNHDSTHIVKEMVMTNSGSKVDDKIDILGNGKAESEGIIEESILDASFDDCLSNVLLEETLLQDDGITDTCDIDDNSEEQLLNTPVDVESSDSKKFNHTIMASTTDDSSKCQMSNSSSSLPEINHQKQDKILNVTEKPETTSTVNDSVKSGEIHPDKNSLSSTSDVLNKESINNTSSSKLVTELDGSVNASTSHSPNDPATSADNSHSKLGSSENSTSIPATKQNADLSQSSNSLKNNTNESSPLTFSDALNSMEISSELGMVRPPSIIPSTESSMLDNSIASLTELKQISSVRSVKESSSLPSYSGAFDSHMKKRAFPIDSEDETSSEKPDLKKVRVFNVDDEKTNVDSSNMNGRKLIDAEQIAKNVEMANFLKKTKEKEMPIQNSVNFLNKTKGKEMVVQTSVNSKCENKENDDVSIIADAPNLETKTAEGLPNVDCKKLKKIKRKDLENIVIELFVDKVLYEHQLGQQKELCKKLEATLESHRKKAAQFHKELEDLQKVTKRLHEEHLTRKSQIIAPVKVKRSVGIQANPSIIAKGVMHTSLMARQNLSVNLPSRAPATTQVTKPQNTVNRSTNTANHPTKSSGPSLMMVNQVPIVMQPQPQVQNTKAVTHSTPSILQSALQTVASNSKKNSSNVIDLTDDDEVSRGGSSSSKVLAIQRPINSGQKASSQIVAVNNPQTSVGQLVLVPTSLGQTTAALVVGALNSNTTGSGITSLPTLRPIPSASGQNIRLANNQHSGVLKAARYVVPNSVISMNRHPAPLPRTPPQQTGGYSKKLPPPPQLKLSRKENSIVLSWNLARTDEHERIASYQLYAYQEGNSAPSSSLWKKVGSVKALELPMACTLTQFMPGHIYHFAVRAVDIRTRLGPFSIARSIQLGMM